MTNKEGGFMFFFGDIILFKTMITIKKGAHKSFITAVLYRLSTPSRLTGGTCPVCPLAGSLVKSVIKKLKQQSQGKTLQK